MAGHTYIMATQVAYEAHNDEWLMSVSVQWQAENRDDDNVEILLN